jgi:hypothetical protein
LVKIAFTRFIACLRFINLKIKSIVKSTIAFELLSLSEALEQAILLRHIVKEYTLFSSSQHKHKLPLTVSATTVAIYKTSLRMSRSLSTTSDAENRFVHVRELKGLCCVKMN